MNGVAEIVEEAQHHPEINIRHTRVLLKLTTHDAGGVTDADIELAQRIDNLIAKNNGSRYCAQHCVARESSVFMGRLQGLSYRENQSANAPLLSSKIIDADELSTHCGKR